MKKVLMIVVTAALLFSGCSAKEGIELSDVWVRPATQGMNSAVYFVIQNNNAESDELVGAASDVADAVEIHESKMEGDVMKMNRVESVTLEPSVKVEFMPGGYHVMLIGLKQDLKTGDEIKVTLQFRDSPEITITATVKEAGGMQSMEEGHSP